MEWVVIRVIVAVAWVVLIVDTEEVSITPVVVAAEEEEEVTLT